MNRRIMDIEVLRGIAVLLVVVHHTNGNLYSWSSPFLERFFAYFGGGVGVDLFFAISGFVIARELLPRLENAKSDDKVRVVISFWVKRAWRLWPSAWLWLLIPLLLVVFFNDSHAFGSLRANVEATAAGLAHVANLRMIETFGAKEYGATFAYWSLSLEEQFYLLLPLLALLFRQRLVWILGAVVLLQLLDPRETLMAVCFRTDAICIGVLLAIFSRRRMYAITFPAFMRNRVVSMAAPLMLIGLLIIFGPSQFDVAPYNFSIVAILAGVLTFLAAHNQDLIFHRQNWLRRPMIWIGERSYAIYLVHVPSFFLIREFWYRYSGGVAPTHDQFALFTLSAVVLVLVLSDINYRLIEQPLRRHGARIASGMLSNHPAPTPASVTLETPSEPR